MLYKPISRTHYYRGQALKCCAAVFASACLAGATMVPLMDLNKLTEQSDLIVVASVIEVREVGRTTVSVPAGVFDARLNTATLQIEKVLKGRVEDSAVSFRFAYPQARLGYAMVSAEQFGIFFLRKEAEGYAVIDPYNPFAPAVPGAPESEGTPLDRVTAEVAYLFVSPEATIGMRKESEFKLMPVVTPKATAALKIAAQDQNLGVRTIAMGMLLARGDISMLDSAAKMLLDSQQMLSDSDVSMLASGLEGGVNNPQAVPQLAKLLHCRFARIRRGAAAALRNTGNAAAIGPLCEALQDGDREVQYQAVIGLAEITGTVGDWAPSTDTFRNDPRLYLDHWREWAKSQK